VELQSQLTTIRARGFGVAAILYEPPEVLKAFSDRFGIEFPLLADVGSKVITHYGLLNRTATGDHAGIPYPGTFILDPQGRVVARFFERAYQERFTSSDILVRLEGPGPAGHVAQQITTPHLTVRTWPSDETVAPGERFGLVFDVEPNAGIHVYAPGQEGYLPVALTLAEDSGYKTHPIDYPRAQIYDFKPLEERVKVYSRPFRLVQELTVSLSREMRARSTEPDATLTIRGTFRYQACDDQVCFMPATLPVEWTVRLKPLVTPERR
jgi:hypothetical protein